MGGPSATGAAVRLVWPVIERHPAPGDPRTGSGRVERAGIGTPGRGWDEATLLNLNVTSGEARRCGVPLRAAGEGGVLRPYGRPNPNTRVETSLDWCPAYQVGSGGERPALGAIPLSPTRGRPAVMVVATPREP